MNREVCKVQNWLVCNKLSVHYAKKTQFILFIPKAKTKEKPKEFNILMGGNVIEQTSTYKYLGVIIDENLNWVPQITKMCSKLSSVCGILSKVRHLLDRNSLMMIYNSLVESRLRYGILSWSTASEAQLQKLCVLQNKAIRYIHFSPPWTTILPLYAHFKVLPLNKLILLQQVTYMFNFHNGLLPEVFRTYCSKPAHRYNTRFAKTNYSLAPCRSAMIEKHSIKVIGPKVWTMVPEEAKILPFRKSFAKHMKNLYLSEFPTEISIKDIISKNQAEKLKKWNDLNAIFQEDNEEIHLLGFDLELEPVYWVDS